MGIGMTNVKGKAGVTGGTWPKTTGVKCDGVMRPSVLELNRLDAAGYAL